jgi:hypothetical protein
MLAYFQSGAPADFLMKGRMVSRRQGQVVPVLKAMIGAGCHFNQEWIDLPPIPETCLDPKFSWRTYWDGCIVTRPDGTEEDGLTIADRFLNKPKEHMKTVDPSDYTFTHQGEHWLISGPGGVWQVEAKLVLNHDDLCHLLNLLVAFVPPGKTVSLQADSHRAGNCWVGLVCSYDETRIPFVPISADIGCGMCMLPILKDGEQLNTRSLGPEEFRLLQIQVSMTARRTLARGKTAEQGKATVQLVDEVMTFLGTRESPKADLQKWLDDFLQVFDELQIKVPRDNLLDYILGFGMTLGSSGNHFLEMNEGSDGRLYLVIHSGSRALGAMVYQKISFICSTLYGSNAMAVGKYVDIYNKAYSVLNKFAVINRILCAIGVLKQLGFAYDGQLLKEYLIHQNPLFAGIADHPEQIGNLIKGVTHNGVKCFVNHQTQQKIFILCKGSIAISARASCGIVALRAGEGVEVLVMLNPDAKWLECDLGEIQYYDHYQIIYDISSTDIEIMGHGAGRSGSATNTWKNSEYSSMLEYYHRNGIIGNLSPNVLGDNPEIAYKSVEEVIKYLPESRALSKDRLRTRVNHKEGIDPRPHFRTKFADFVMKHWKTMTDEEKLMCDLILVKSDLWLSMGGLTRLMMFSSMYKEQDDIYRALISKP